MDAKTEPIDRRAWSPDVPPHLARLLSTAASNWPDHPAVEDERGASLTYEQLAVAAHRLATRLERYGVGRGDRVGLFLPKSLEAVAAIHGILASGAAYVPVDPTAPAPRGAGILADAFVKAIVVSAELAAALRSAWPGPAPLPRLVVVGADADSVGPGACAWSEIQADDTPAPPFPPRDSDDTAYILYTSGSTGKPKGVTLTHANAFCFLDWCEATFELRPGDRFSSHAPFHFDLSVFDLYASCRAGGTLVLLGESLGKDPARLGDFLATRNLDVWYSAPSILALMTEHGGIDRAGFAPPRLVLFAGEVFPVRHLRRLRGHWPVAELWNLYGPTETNVCTAYRIPDTIPDDRTDPYPIGPACPPLRGRVVDELGCDVPCGAEGELVITGPGVMRGYFGRPDLTDAAFFRAENGDAWYRTGDLVVETEADGYIYHGRRDRMVKKRGYRIELGEIETALYRCEGVARAAVVATSDDSGLSITAFLAMKEGAKASLIALKRHCAECLPVYMVPDAIRFLPALPSTSTDKVDYQALKALVSSGTSRLAS